MAKELIGIGESIHASIPRTSKIMKELHELGPNAIFPDQLVDGEDVGRDVVEGHLHEVEARDVVVGQVGVGRVPPDFADGRRQGAARLLRIYLT